jgi:hypothetical protein
MPLQGYWWAGVNTVLKREKLKARNKAKNAQTPPCLMQAARCVRRFNIFSQPLLKPVTRIRFLIVWLRSNILIKTLRLSDNSNGYFHSFRLNGKLCALTSWRIFGKPLHPFFVHSCEIVRIAQDKCCTHNFIQRAARRLKNSINVFQTMSSLLLDCCANNFSCRGVKRSLTSHENESASFYTLTISC